MINFIVWLIVGAVLGWLASMLMNRNGQQNLLMDVIVGIVGAFIGGFLLAPLFNTGTINSGDFSLSGLIVSFLGAVVLLAIVNLFRRGAVR